MHANDRAALESRMSKYQKEIKLTNKLLKETYSSKRKSATYLKLLNKKIELRKKLVVSLETEIAVLAESIQHNERQILSLKQDIEAIKNEYRNLILYAHKNKNDYERLMYVLAADDFNQAYKRLMYFQQYSKYRKRQVSLLQAKQDTLNIFITRTEEVVASKKELIASQKQEADQLLSEKHEQSAIVQNLSKKEKQLLSELKKKQRQADKLKKEIQEIIALEAKKRKEKEKYSKTPEEVQYSKNFAENKGRLIWPTSTGIITSKFGEHPHPVLKNIKVINNGIDISTEKNASVRAIFEGVVSKIIVIPGSNAAIIIRHGDYLTVYSNIVNVRVKPGQKVSAKQTIGTVFTDEDNGQTTLQLQIWNETKKLNPELWIKKL